MLYSIAEKSVICKEIYKRHAKKLAFFIKRRYNKTACRDGGAAERARFEIVLGGNVYKGSNPFLCAMWE